MLFYSYTQQQNTCREIFEAKRWNDDERFQSPSALLKGTPVFSGEIVSFEDSETRQLCIGKILKFIIQVKSVHIDEIIHNNIILHRK